MPPVRCGSNVTGRSSAPADDAADQPSAAPCPRAPPPQLRGSRLRRHPRSTRPPHPALGRRRPHRVGQPRALCPYHHRLHHRGVITITGPAHHLRVTDRAGRTQPRIARAPPEPASARGATVSRTHRRARGLVAGINRSSRNHHRRTTSPVAGGSVMTSTVSKLKRLGASPNSFALPAASAS